MVEFTEVIDIPPVTEEDIAAILREGFPFPTMRPTQDSALKAIAKTRAEKKKFTILELPTGTGKCLGPNTLVMMFDGTTKAARDIVIGDQLMGPDSKPRNVLSLASGVDEMYEIGSNSKRSNPQFTPYIVNSAHILALRYSGKLRQGVSRSEKNKALQHNRIVGADGKAEIAVADYLALTTTFRHCLKSYKVGLDFEEQKVPISPHFLGLWLGDGSKESAEITSADSEIVDYIYSFAAEWSLKITVSPLTKWRTCPSYCINTQIRGGGRKAQKNKLLRAMQNLGVINNKRIPALYLNNSREVRMAVLAGLVDSDGHMNSSGTCEIMVKSDELCLDVLRLVRSLGFAASHKVKFATNQSKGKIFRVNRIHFWGPDAIKIPTLLVRKKAPTRTINKNHLVGGVKVTPLGLGPYNGFLLDGDGLFLLGDFTVTHNSPIGISAAHYAEGLSAPNRWSKDNVSGAYILTSQKSLQSQLMEDFRHLGLVELRGKNNYQCKNALTPTDCDTASIATGAVCDGCPYREAKDIFGFSGKGVTNYSYFMHESVYSGELPNKEMLITDEAHNLEKEILNLVEIRITPARCSDLDVAGTTPYFVAGEEDEAIAWLEKYFVPALKNRIRDLRMEASDLETDPNAEGHLPDIRKKLSTWNNFLSRIQMFTECIDPNEWVVWTDEDKNLLIKPLTGAMFASDFLFKNASSVVMLSATILDFKTFRRNLGIEPSNSVCMRAASEFPVENRKIVFWPTGNMGYKDIQETLPRMVGRIENILTNRFNDVKGIIHAHTYKIAKDIVGHLNSAGLGSRIITHTNEPGDREKAIMRHVTDPGPTVLISPSMTEGLDLKGDLSRFQIICKVPYPFIDPYTKVRMERDPDWYQLQTALTLLQASGRSNRSADDWATTIILDSSFGQFLARNEGILPAWWRAAIVIK